MVVVGLVVFLWPRVVREWNGVPFYDQNTPPSVQALWKVRLIGFLFLVLGVSAIAAWLTGGPECEVAFGR
jgi:hypothetical protein